MDYTTGDINSTKKGSGARANGGKISLSLVPFHLFGGVTRVLMSGKLKYAGWNWARGMQWSVCVDCALRHLFKWWFMGEEIDPESGEHHLDHVLTNILFLKHYTQTYKEGDDRPPGHVDFKDWLGDFNTPFNEEEYLDRNPEIRELLAKRKAEQEAKKQEAEAKDFKQARGEYYASQSPSPEQFGPAPVTPMLPGIDWEEAERIRKLGQWFHVGPDGFQFGFNEPKSTFAIPLCEKSGSFMELTRKYLAGELDDQQKKEPESDGKS